MNRRKALAMLSALPLAACGGGDETYVGREIATADVTANVSPGESIQAAIDYLLNDVDFAGHFAIVQLADGEYAQTASIPRQPLGQNLISIRGNQANYGAVRWIAPAGQSCCSVQNGGIGVLAYMELGGTTGGALLSTRQNGIANFLYGRLGAIPNGVQLTSTLGGVINCNGYHALVGGADTCLEATTGGRILLHGQAFSIMGNLTYTSFCRAVGSGSNIIFGGATYSGGIVSGSQGLVSNNAAIDRGGSTIPGTSAIVATNGGMVI